MDVVIAVSNGNANDLFDLNAWLRREDELRARVRLETAPVIPGEMGTIPELVAVAIGSGGAVSILAGSLSSWLAQRRSDITLEVSTRDGRTVKLNAQRVAEVDQLLRDVLGETGSTE